jgi:D-glycero-D-manno-heptose 1,7-bisphosphate phosphatase
MYKLLLLDVDGTLGKPKSGGDFRETANDWDFFPGRVEACRELTSNGTTVITVSNQGGVCFPWSKFSEVQIRAVLDETAQAIGAMASLVSCSSPNKRALPEYYNENDPRRKPNPGMLKEAMEMAGVGAEDTLMVGDRPEDEASALACGVAFRWASDFFGD